MIERFEDEKKPGYKENIKVVKELIEANYVLY
jgi:hypothetical protein